MFSHELGRGPAPQPAVVNGDARNCSEVTAEAIPAARLGGPPPGLAAQGEKAGTVSGGGEAHDSRDPQAVLRQVAQGRFFGRQLTVGCLNLDHNLLTSWHDPIPRVILRTTRGSLSKLDRATVRKRQTRGHLQPDSGAADAHLAQQAPAVAND